MRQYLTRERGIWLSLIIGLIVVSGSGIAFATSRTNGQYNCSRVDRSDGSWALNCVVAPSSPSPSPSPSPSTSPTPSPSPTVVPTSPAPTTTSPTPVPTTPSPTPTGPLTNCFERLAACGYPTIESTGVPAGTTLTAYAGPFTVRTDGAIIDGKIISCIAIAGQNVTIRNSKIVGPCFYGVDMSPGGSLVIEDSEVDCTDGHGTGVAWSHFAARRLYVHDCENGFEMGDGSSVEDSYVSAREATSQGHGDGIQSQGGNGVVIRHNTIASLQPVTSSIITNPTLNNGWRIEGNFLSAGAFTLYCPEEGTDFEVRDNRFYGPVMTKDERDRLDQGDSTVDRHKPAFGFVDACNHAGITWSGNYRDDNLSAVGSAS